MELLESSTEYLVVDGGHCLRCSRATGRLEAADALALAEQSDPVCLGNVFGVVGCVQFTSDGFFYLVLIKDRKRVASHPSTGVAVYKIEKVVAIPLTLINSNGNDNIRSDLQLSPCPKHQRCIPANRDSSTPLKPSVVAGFSLLQRGQQKMAKATTDSFKFVANKMSIGRISGNNLNQMQIEEKERLRAERRLVLEFLRIFNDSGSFYYCPGGDLTNTVQRVCNRKNEHLSSAVEQFDTRFVWNLHMLRDLVKQESESQHSSLARHWITPIIQGFIGVEECSITLGDYLMDSPVPRGVFLPETFQFRLMVISRRSVNRAGTRYIKRGIDANGHCANYVETEQILIVGDYGNHAAAFVQARGSVPVYWSQPGFKYKPAPKLDKPKMESELAFRKHFDYGLQSYSNVIIVNLVEQTGKEKVLSDAYIDHVLQLDLENITYVSFDFHEHCRGMKFENVAILTAAIEEQIAQNGFCWVDKGIANCLQQGICRVNCVDCLDRTNVVQAAFGRTMLEVQLRKFGILPPEELLPASCLRPFQLLWAANGDAISRQYAGTVALKGDYTRTGQRNLAGMMKDGYNSANRYYLCHMKDARRQAAIDALLGWQTIQNEQDIENLLKLQLEDGSAEDEAAWLKEKDEQLRLFVRDCERLVVPDGEVILGSWAFINADPGAGNDEEEDMDTCVVLTRQAYYVADYDEDLDKFVDCQRVPLSEVRKIETGPMTVASVLGVPKSKATCLRIFYQMGEANDDYFHVWRSGSTRLFNNLAIAIKNTDEADEYMKAVAEQFSVSLELRGHHISVIYAQKLERKRSKLSQSKLAYRKNGNVFGTPAFLSWTSSVSGGMKSFGNRFSAAFNYRGGSKVFRPGSIRRNNGNYNTPDQLNYSINHQIPLLEFDQPEDASAAATKPYMDVMVSAHAGLLFGRCGSVNSQSKPSLSTLRRSQSELYDSSGKRELIRYEHSGELFPGSCPYSPAISVEQISVSLSPRVALGPPFLEPAQVSPSSNLTMKTSHSEACFKLPKPADTTSSHRALASSQNALDDANQTNQATSSVGLKFPMLFKTSSQESNKSSAVKKKFIQFEDRIQNSRTKFILL